MISFERGEEIVSQDAPAEEVFIIVSGNVKILCAGRLVATLSAQNILGLEGLYNRSGTYSYTAQADSPCRLVRYKASEFLESFHQTPRLTELAFSSLARQLDLCWEKAVHNGPSSPELVFSGDIRSYERGEWIIREGEDTSEIFRIISTDQGVEVSKAGQILAILTEPGEIFGEMASVLKEKRTASVRALGETVLEVYPPQHLLGVLSDYSDISLRIIRSLSRRLAETSQLAAEGDSGGDSSLN